MQIGLDEGGFARLDVSDLRLSDGGDNGQHEVDEVEGHPSRPCDWCGGTQRGGGEYLVVADKRHYAVCPTCWGRSPGYVELRQEGVAHEQALARLGTRMGTGAQMG
jgi:hypothetical protein